MSSPEKITVTQIAYESRMVPMVLVGRTSDEAAIYVRYRFGILSIRLDPRPGEDGAGGVRIFEAQVGGRFDGWIDYEVLRDLTADSIVWPTTEPD